MTLTNWLGDYLFTPLRMALRGWGQAGLVTSLAINMLAIGVWHGASWTYVVFGLIHAGFLILSSFTLRRRKKLLQRSAAWSNAHTVIGPLVTFHLVVASLVFFRASSVSDAWYVLQHACGGLVSAMMATGHGGTAVALWGDAHLNWTGADIVVAVVGVIVMESVHLLQRTETLPRLIVATPGWARWAAYYALGFAILLWGESGSRQFLYVRF